MGDSSFSTGEISAQGLPRFVTRTFSPLPTRRSTSPVRFLSSLALIDFIIPTSHFTVEVAPCRGPSMCPDRHAGGAPGYSAGIFEPHKDAVRRWIKGHVPVAPDEDAESGHGVGVDQRGDAGGDN